MLNSILIFSQYNPPDNGGAVKRLEQLLYALNLIGSFRIVIIGTEPHYPFKQTNRSQYEYPFYKNLNIEIQRMKMPNITHKSNVGRIVNYLHYSICSIILSLKFRSFPITLCLSPNFFSFFPGRFYSKLFRSKIYFDVPDLWPDVPIELGYIKNKFIIRVLKIIEIYQYLASDKILTVSDGLKIAIQSKSKIPSRKVVSIPNWFYKTQRKNIPPKKSLNIDNIRIGYLGILNNNYDFNYYFKILKLYPSWELVIKGWGEKLAFLRNKVKKEKLLNVRFISSYLTPQKLDQEISNWDYFIIPLKNNFANKYILPAKLGDAIKNRVPILTNSNSMYLSQFITKNKIGFAINDSEIKDFVSELTDYTKYKTLKLNMQKEIKFYSQKDVIYKIQSLFVQ